VNRNEWADANVSEKHTVSIFRAEVATSLHGTKTQKNIIIIITTTLTAVKTSNPTSEKR
jgi:hypothetical protein